MSFRWELIQSPSFLFAAKGSKVILAIVVAIGLLGIVYWMLRSLGIDRNTPPSMILRKLHGFLRSFYTPVLSGGKWKRAAKWEEKKKYDAAVDIYVQLFDYDGLLSSRASIAIHNDRCLEHLEDVCKVVGYPFPTDRINRLREDIYDFFLVKQKYLAPTDYDGTELTRPENEQRFSDKLNLTQEQALVDGFRNFLQSFSAKLKKHIISGAPPIVTPEDPSQSVAVSNVDLENVVNHYEGGVSEAISAPPLPAPSDPFGAPAAVEAPLPEPPGIFGANQSDAPLPAPPNPFGNAVSQPAELGAPPAPPMPSAPEPNPFSIDDPRVPHHEATGRIHKLPGQEEDHISSPAESTQIAPMPQPGNAGFPGGPGFPQPTGGFPGMGSTPPTPNPAAAATPAFPQPTGGFPGFAGPPPTPNPGMAPSTPQPTGGFPGLTGGIGTPAPGSQPPGAPNFPQPTGGFPGFGGAPATPNPAATPAFPQPTGGFPGFAGGPGTPAPGSQPPGAPNFPQPTGGFPGFGGAPATPNPAGPASQPPGAPGFPQPTGGFPGFGAPGTPPPFPSSDDKNK